MNLPNVKKQDLYSVLLIIFIFIALRFLFICFTPYSFNCEEAKTASLGCDLIFENGLKLPVWGYMDSPHSGGSLLAGISAIPFYCIFGNRYLALKITALSYSVVTVILWYILISHEIKNRKKYFFLVFLILFSFGVPHYFQKTVILIGNTVELMFFNALVIFYFWRIKNNIFLDKKRLFLLGAICGFSFWVQFLSLYLFITIILFLLLTKQLKSVMRYLPYLLTGFIFGTLPLWIYNVQYNWATFTADHQSLGFSFSLEKFRKIILIDIPASFHFLDIGKVKAQYFGYALFGLFLAAILIHMIEYLKKRNEKIEKKFKLESFLILYFIIFIFSMIFTNVPIGGSGITRWNSMNVQAESYIVCLQPVIFALILLLCKYAKYIYINSIVGVLLITGCCVLFLRPQYNYRMLQPMHSTESNAYECGFNFFLNPKLFISFEKKVPPELKSYYFEGAGLAINNLLPIQAVYVSEMTAQLNEKFKTTQFWQGLLLKALVGHEAERRELMDLHYKYLFRILPIEIQGILNQVYNQQRNAPIN